VAWGDDQQGVQARGAEGAGDHFLLAGMGAGRQHHLAWAGRGLEPRQLTGVKGKGFANRLQVQPRAGPGAQLRQTRLGFGVLRQDKVEGREQGSRGAGSARPAVGAGLGHPGRDKGQLHPAGLGGEDQVRPKLALDLDARVRPPMVQEAANCGGAVHRRVLVDHAGRQALGQKFGGGAGARGDKKGAAGRSQGLGQRQQGKALADADSVQPDQPARRPGHAGVAKPLVKAGGIFLAPPRAAAEQSRRQGLGEPGRGGVERE
jgi:hypothetical protein